MCVWPVACVCVVRTRIARTRARTRIASPTAARASAAPQSAPPPPRSQIEMRHEGDKEDEALLAPRALSACNLNNGHEAERSDKQQQPVRADRYRAGSPVRSTRISAARTRHAAARRIFRALMINSNFSLCAQFFRCLVACVDPSS